jgi:hypothetical protein
MKRTATTMTATAVLVLFALTGCTTPPSDGSAAEKRVVEETPAIDPGPIELTVEEAGDRYLDIVCANNFAIENLNAAFVAGEPDHLNGGAPDPTAVKEAAAETARLARLAIEVLDDDYYMWPEEIADQIPHIRTGYLAQLTTDEQIALSKTYDEAYYTPQTETTVEQKTAGQEIRLQLKLPSDTMASCEGHEDGLRVLTEEKTERDEGLAKQD